MSRQTSLTGRLKRRISKSVSRQLHDYILNHFVNRLPLVAVRMWAYKTLGVRLADWRTGMVMLGAEIFAPRNLTIGRGSVVGRCVLDARGYITIGADVNIGSGVALQTAKHVVDSPTFEAAFAPITVGDRAWIAQGATVLGGVTIGKGAVVAAGSIVTKDVAPYTIVSGIPAGYKRDRSRDLVYRLHYRENLV